MHYGFVRKGDLSYCIFATCQSHRTSPSSPVVRAKNDSNTFKICSTYNTTHTMMKQNSKETQHIEIPTEV